MSESRIVIATRQSRLALWQANFIRARLERAHPGLSVELLGMTTAGDRWLSSPLSEVGGKGLFVKALEDALLAGRADIAVHSMKDVPATLPEAFVLPVIGFRHFVCVFVGGRACFVQVRWIAIEKRVRAVLLPNHVNCVIAQDDNPLQSDVNLGQSSYGR